MNIGVAQQITDRHYVQPKRSRRVKWNLLDPGRDPKVMDRPLGLHDILIDRKLHLGRNHIEKNREVHGTNHFNSQNQNNIKNR